MNQILKSGISLMVVTVIAAIALSFVYNIAKPRMDEQDKIMLNNALKSVMPDANSFEKQGDYYNAIKDDEVIGRVYYIETAGYGGIIKLVVGVKDNKIIKVAVLEQKETPGLGSKITEEAFLNQFIGKEPSTLQLKKYGGDIDAVTSATISSKAVVDRIRNIR